MKLRPGAELMVVEFKGSLRLIPVQAPSALRGIARGVDVSIEDCADRAV